MPPKRKVTDYFGGGGAASRRCRPAAASHPPRARAMHSAAESAFTACPCCSTSVALHRLDDHLDTCGVQQATRPRNHAPLSPAPLPTAEAAAPNAAAAKAATSGTAVLAQWQAAAARKSAVEWLRPAVPHSTLTGQVLLPDFVSVDEEAELLAWLDDATTTPPWRSATFNGRHRGRRWGDQPPAVLPSESQIYFTMGPTKCCSGTHYNTI